MKVSIIVPIYRVERYIEKCAESVLSQTWPDIQFIFVNDGTPDRSIELLEALIDSRFAHLKDRIVIINKENGGLPQARLSGLKVATGDFVMHVDSDDWVETDMVERLVRKAEETGADIVYHYVCKENDVIRVHIAKDPEFARPVDFGKAIMKRTAHGYLVSKFIRRSLYTDKLFYPTLSMHEDMILSTQILSYAKKAVLIPIAPYHYRRDNPDAMTRQNRAKRHTASARNFLALYRFYNGFTDCDEELKWLKGPVLDYCMTEFLKYDRQSVPEIRDAFLALPLTLKRLFLRIKLSYTR